jgi:hypothetical protein
VPHSGKQEPAIKPMLRKGGYRALSADTADLGFDLHRRRHLPRLVHG